jgi:hypothetical protein
MSASPEWGEFVSKAVTWGRERVDAAKEDRLRRADPVYLAAQRRQAAIAERERALQIHAVAEQRHVARRKRLTMRAATGNYVAAGAAGLGVMDVVTGIGQPMVNGVIPASPGLWFVTAAVAALIGVRARLQLTHATPPPAPALPAIPPPVLSPSAVGAEDAAEVFRAEAQLVAMIPAVDQIHPEAGMSLRATMHAVQPRMHGLIERLELLSNINAMKAPQAAEAAETLRRRLAQGAVAYDRLIAATATLLAAPDPGGAANDSLSMAAYELEAYAAGLAAASNAMDGRPHP